MHISEVIARKREYCKLTQRALGKASSISEARVRHIEWGHESPTFEELQRIAAALDTKVWRLAMLTEEELG